MENKVKLGAEILKITHIQFLPLLAEKLPTLSHYPHCVLYPHRLITPEGGKAESNFGNRRSPIRANFN